MGRRRRQRASKPSRMSTEREFRHGFVVVHGIGPTTGGGTVSAVVEPVVDTIRARLRDHRSVAVSETKVDGQESRVVAITAPGKQAVREVLFTEARWTAESMHGRRLSIAAVWWTLRSIVTMLPSLLLPSAAEFKPLADSASDRQTVTRRVRRAVSFLGVPLRIGWRVTTVATSIAAVVFVEQLLVGIGPWLAVGASVLAVVALLVALVLSPTDFGGQVRLVVQEQQVRDRVQAVIDRALHAVAERCDEVTVIAHSQGGFLVHDLLRTKSEHHLAVTGFVGLGSGLKPISLLEQFRSGRLAAGTAIALLGVTVSTAGSWNLLEPGRLFGNTTIPNLVWGFLMMWAVPLSGPFLLSAMGKEWNVLVVLPSGVVWANSLPWIGLVVVGALIVWCGRRVSGPRALAIRIEALHRRVRWAEYSTPHDVVGRMAVPELPAGCRVHSVEGSHPLLDHRLASYMRPGGTVAIELAARTLDALGSGSAAKRLRAETRGAVGALKVVSTRWYRLRGGLQFGLLVLFVLVPTVVGSGGLFTGFRTAWWVSLVIAVVAGICATQTVESARRAIARSIGAATTRTLVSATRRTPVNVIALLAAIVMNDLFAALGTALWLGLAGLSSAATGAFVLHALVTGFVLVLFACGFRPWPVGAVLWTVYTFQFLLVTVGTATPVGGFHPGVLAAVGSFVLQGCLSVAAVRLRRRERAA